MATDLDNWLRSANFSIIDVIESAIRVAISDCPKELRRRRDQITEKLYTYPLLHCNDCERLEQPQPSAGEELNQVVSNSSYNEAEASNEENEQENQTIGEVMRIKNLLVNNQDESDSVVIDLLRQLQLMCLTVETLEATEIGKVVNSLRRHSSKQIRLLVRTLKEHWKVLVEEWASATVAMANNALGCPSPADMDTGEGLPSPPLDIGAFLLDPPTTSFQLLEFFDGMDDDGNCRISDKDPKSLEREKKHQSSQGRGQTKNQEPAATQEKLMEAPVRRQEPALKQTRPSSIDKEGTRRQTRDTSTDSKPKLPQEKKGSCEMSAGVQKKLQSSTHDKQSGQAATDSGPERPQKQSPNYGLQKKPLTSLQDKSKNSEDTMLLEKLESAKRKLQENYQQAENAKKKRMIQVLDFPEMKQHNIQPGLKHKTNIRNRIDCLR